MRKLSVTSPDEGRQMHRDALIQLKLKNLQEIHELFSKYLNKNL